MDWSRGAPGTDEDGDAVMTTSQYSEPPPSRAPFSSVYPPSPTFSSSFDEFGDFDLADDAMADDGMDVDSPDPSPPSGPRVGVSVPEMVDSDFSSSSSTPFPDSHSHSSLLAHFLLHGNILPARRVFDSHISFLTPLSRLSRPILRLIRRDFLRLVKRLGPLHGPDEESLLPPTPSLYSHRCFLLRCSFRDSFFWAPSLLICSPTDAGPTSIPFRRSVRDLIETFLYEIGENEAEWERNREIEERGLRFSDDEVKSELKQRFNSMLVGCFGSDDFTFVVRHWCGGRGTGGGASGEMFGSIDRVLGILGELVMSSGVVSSSSEEITLTPFQIRLLASYVLLFDVLDQTGRNIVLSEGSSSSIGIDVLFRNPIPSDLRWREALSPNETIVTVNSSIPRPLVSPLLIPNDLFFSLVPASEHVLTQGFFAPQAYSVSEGELLRMLNFRKTDELRSRLPFLSSNPLAPLTSVHFPFPCSTTTRGIDPLLRILDNDPIPAADAEILSTFPPGGSSIRSMGLFTLPSTPIIDSLTGLGEFHVQVQVDSSSASSCSSNVVVRERRIWSDVSEESFQIRIERARRMFQSIVPSSSLLSLADLRLLRTFRRFGNQNQDNDFTLMNLYGPLREEKRVVQRMARLFIHPLNSIWFRRVDSSSHPPLSPAEAARKNEFAEVLRWLEWKILAAEERLKTNHANATTMMEEGDDMMHFDENAYSRREDASRGVGHRHRHGFEFDYPSTAAGDFEFAQLRAEIRALKIKRLQVLSRAPAESLEEVPRYVFHVAFAHSLRCLLQAVFPDRFSSSVALAVGEMPQCCDHVRVLLTPSETNFVMMPIDGSDNGNES